MRASVATVPPGAGPLKHAGPRTGEAQVRGDRSTLVAQLWREGTDPSRMEVRERASTRPVKSGAVWIAAGVGALVAILPLAASPVYTPGAQILQGVTLFFGVPAHFFFGELPWRLEPIPPEVIGRCALANAAVFAGCAAWVKLPWGSWRHPFAVWATWLALAVFAR